MLVDLKTPEGLDVLGRLVERADVVMQNFRLGVAERLGIGYEQVKARRPDIVYGSVSFCGYGGPWERVPGYEPNAQAVTGMAARMGGEAGPPGPQPFAPNDYATGLLGAFAVGLALFHRQRSGEGQHVQTSLVAAATVLQAALIPHGRWPGHGARGARLEPAPAAVPRERRVVLSRRRGFATRSARRAGWPPRHHGPERPRARGGPSGVFRQAAGDGMGERAGRGRHRSAATRLGDRAHAATHGSSPMASASPASTRRGDAITTIGPPFRLSRTPVVPGALVAAPGADAADVLADLGMADRIDELVARRAIALE